METELKLLNKRDNKIHSFSFEEAHNFVSENNLKDSEFEVIEVIYHDKNK